MTPDHRVTVARVAVRIQNRIKALFRSRGVAVGGQGVYRCSEHEEWIATLERLKGIDFDTVMPGHGVVFKGKTKITAFQNYLRDALTQVTALRKQGLKADDAASKVDVTKYRDEFANIRGVGIDAAAVRSIYQLADHPEPAK